MKLINIIISCLNEERRLIPTLEAYVEFLSQNKTKLSGFDIKLYIVNDGSIDHTAEVAKEFIQKHSLSAEVFTYKKNRGKGFGIKYGMLTSRDADLYYMADSDLSSPWETLIKLIESISESDYAIAIGSRYLKTSDTDNTLVRKLFSRISWFLTFFILGLNYNDTQCGYKLFTRSALSVFKYQTINRWGFDFEILYIARLLGLKIKEVGVKWKADSDSRVQSGDYIRTFKELLKVKLTKYESLDDNDLFSREFLWYFFIGIAGIFVDFAVSAIFKEIMRIDALWANLAGMHAGIINNFIWNRELNFKQKDKLLMRFISFYTVGLFGIALGSFIVYILHSMVGYNFYTVKIFSTVIVSLIQFFLNKAVSFRKI
ncbi:bifunctional glycosyltransferase family 2/GtrA family protein [Candidatus Dojkabacteria bacterium]|nr:bifunctional glycosyltransferase family 2/GtrA family protein [Candidatus Dojkabacteria bacterium]